MAVTDPKPMSRAAVVANAIGLPLGLIALVFLPVGRLDWKPGWIFIAFLVAAFGGSTLIVARVNPSIFRARSRFQPGTKRWDLILVTLILFRHEPKATDNHRRAPCRVMGELWTSCFPGIPNVFQGFRRGPDLRYVSVNCVSPAVAKTTLGSERALSRLVHGRLRNLK